MSMPSKTWVQWASIWNSLDPIEAYVSQQVPFEHRGAALDALVQLRSALEAARPEDGPTLRSGSR